MVRRGSPVPLASLPYICRIFAVYLLSVCWLEIDLLSLRVCVLSQPATGAIDAIFGWQSSLPQRLQAARI